MVEAKMVVVAMVVVEMVQVYKEVGMTPEASLAGPALHLERPLASLEVPVLAALHPASSPPRCPPALCCLSWSPRSPPPEELGQVGMAGLTEVLKV